MTTDQLATVLAKNRAEELGFDLWEKFVIPHNFKALELLSATKPLQFLGGRGCGKTMVLRWLSHRSLFSPSRKGLQVSDLSHVGLYWRADTQFANAMNHRGIAEDRWLAAFNHYAALLLSIEFLSALVSIAKSDLPDFTNSDLKKLRFDRITSFDQSLSSDPLVLLHQLEDRLWQLETWLNDLDSPKPQFLPGKKVLEAFIKLLKEAEPAFSDTTFHVYVDEYENLLISQQTLINTWLKHSECPLIFNIAMKRDSFVSRKTLGNEDLNNVHDFSTYDLEHYKDQTKADLFAAEVILSRLEPVGIAKLPINAELLHDPSNLMARSEPGYMGSVFEIVRALFPGLTASELAVCTLSQPALRSKLEKNIKSAIAKRNLGDNEFNLSKLDSKPEAFLILPALLSRPRYRDSELVDEYANLPKTSKKMDSWIHNNVVATVLQLYIGHSKACPLYAGFDTFCRLSHGNLRHFLEICHRCLSNVESVADELVLSIDLQAEAAKSASAVLISEVRGFGKRGSTLHTFVQRIGRLFELAHNRPSLSETEQSHFAIIRGASLSNETKAVLEEALKGSVLYAVKATKSKTEYRTDEEEYVLNPIYAPYFGISYRKKRRLELSSEEFTVLSQGSINEYRELIRERSSKWRIDEPGHGLLPLFEEERDEDGRSD